MEAAKALPTEVISRIHKHPDPVVRETMLALYQYLRRDKLRGVSAPALRVGRGVTKRPGLFCHQNKRIAEVGGQLPKLYLDRTTLAVLNEPTNQPVDWLNLQTTLHREDLEAGRTVPLAATSTTPWIPKSPFRKENVWLLVMEKRKECDLKSKSCMTT
ncbi:hypothetical protein PF002_g31908 [Phytophthora fragariae]|uniref:Uncharacterized protein n=1 Tax=Phytophthora fragariae TaxID=53985 RepID=A0A6A3Q060_9STRA|nr:hypothetical protein PF006_g30321 [Phytophthora fragariae]KAE9163250.1 hypothetical protein PF002_g31908 [Phytophthora fragariae]